MTLLDSSSAPIAADTLILGATLVTLDAARRIITDGALAIRGDRIVAIGKREALAPRIEAAEAIDGRGFVMTPGFVNAHIHISGEPLTRGYVPDDTGFAANVFEWLMPLYQAHTPEEQYLSARLAAAEMLRNGVTSFLEAGTILSLDAVVDGLAGTGIRGRVGQWIADRTFDPDQDQTAMIDDAMRRLDDQVRRYPLVDDALIAAWPSLVGHQTNTNEIWRFATELARAHDVGVTAHMSPANMDPQWYLDNTGKRPITHLAELDALGPHLVLTHAVHLDASEVALLAESGSNVCHCPMSALKGAYGATAVGRFPEMADAGVNIALGTDGANNGNIADMMRPMFLVAGLFKDARRDATRFPAHEALEMATLNGARALGMESEIGSLEVGKKADLVLHDTQRPEWQPLLNIVNQLVWSADGRGVHSVWVNGRCVVADHRVTTLDEAALYAAAAEAAPAIVARSGLPDRQAWPLN